eukprot:10532938-Alexandrium_andersonii.AAC.1
MHARNMRPSTHARTQARTHARRHARTHAGTVDSLHQAAHACVTLGDERQRCTPPQTVCGPRPVSYTHLRAHETSAHL